ncbi:uncharacterized protein [Cherax quadricarinatus]|uniref:uncharacterized protein n=1 Tax=Cherax quadricarinatus TaxID=27406 RepID=UPI00387E6A7B
MKTSVCVTVVLVALFVLTCKGHKLKRQDLIPFPRVGKRTPEGYLGDVNYGQESDTPARSQLLQYFANNLLTPLSSILKQHDEESQNSEKPDALLSMLWKQQVRQITGRSNSDHHSLSTAHSSNTHSLQPHPNMQLQQLRSYTSLEQSVLNKLLLRLLLPQLEAQNPAEVEA